MTDREDRLWTLTTAELARVRAVARRDGAAVLSAALAAALVGVEGGDALIERMLRSEVAR